MLKIIIDYFTVILNATACNDVTVTSNLKPMEIRAIDRQAILNLELRLQHCTKLEKFYDDKNVKRAIHGVDGRHRCIQYQLLNSSK